MTEQLNREAFMKEVTFGPDGLVPVIAQSMETGAVLMLAWMNRETLEETLVTREVTYWSRSRSQRWRKGETSGHIQHLIEAWIDCDGDALAGDDRTHERGVRGRMSVRRLGER